MEREVEPLAFENPSFGLLRGWFRSTLDLLVYPQRSFPKIAEGSVLSAMLYSVITRTMLTYIVFVPLACLATFFLWLAIRVFGQLINTPHQAPTPLSGEHLGIFLGAVLVSPAAFALLILVWDLVVGSLYHVAARALDGKAGWSSSLRATFLTAASAIVILAGAFGALVPGVGAFIPFAVTMLIWCWTTYALKCHAVHQHRLPETQAWIAALVVPATSVFVMLVMLALFSASVTIALSALWEIILRAIESLKHYRG